jgi:predicted enzyme related to lactoylglutathione lyase
MPNVTTITPNTPVWIDVASPDLEASKRFYGQVFGWEAVQIAGPEAGSYTLFRIRGKDVAALASQMDPGQPPTWTTYIASNNVDQTVARVKAAGGEIVMEPMDVMSAGRMAMFRDPTGAYLAFWQAGDHKGFQVAQEPGSFAWVELETRDIPRARQFYQEVFGWDVASMPMGPGMPEYTVWKLNGQDVGGGMDIRTTLPPEVPPHWLVYFLVANTDSTAALIKQVGGRVLSEPMDSPGGRFANVADPHGAVFGILQAPSA